MAKIVESLKRLSVENSTRKADKTDYAKGEFVMSVEEPVTNDDQNFILAVCGTQCNDLDFRIAVALSDHTCVVYNAGESINKTTTLNHHQSSIIGVKFSPTSRNIIYTASNDGNITACDLRAKGKVIAEFKDNTEEKLKPLSSFNISCDERLIVGGTEHIGGDAFILFWDIRYSNGTKLNGRSSLLGGYWESHMDDITSLAFHPNKRDALASGSTDGLINIFDLTQTSEDSALTYSLNTESSVDRIGWLTSDNLWCTTHTHSLQLWNYDDAIPYSKFDRNDLPLNQNDDPDSSYLVQIHAPSTFGHPYLLAGSSSSKGECLKCLSFDQNQLEPYYNVVGNKQIVRDSWMHEKSGCLVTGGEAGIINIWRQTESPLIQRNSNHKRTAKIGAEKNRDKNHRTKPY